MLTSAAFPPREGMGFYIWNLSRHLVERGHTVQIISRGGMKRLHREVIAGITIWRATFLPVYPFHVHFHSLFVDRLLRILEPDLDLIHLHTPLVKYPKCQLPTLVTVHTPIEADSKSISTDSPYSLLVKLQKPFSIRLEMEIFAKVDNVVAVSNSVVKELSAYGIYQSSVPVLRNGVDTREFTPGGYSLDGRPTFILTVCRLGPRKGLEDLITCARQVVEQFPQIRFYIAGEGPYFRKFRRAIESLQLRDNVFLLGHIDNREILSDLYQNATAFVHPAHYEGLPTALLEAMACGRPVVATAVCGALDVVEDGVNGLLIPPHAPDRMAQAILRILNDSELGEQLGTAARQSVEDHFSWPEVSQEYIAQYEQLLGEKRN